MNGNVAEYIFSADYKALAENGGDSMRKTILGIAGVILAGSLIVMGVLWNKPNTPKMPKKTEPKNEKEIEPASADLNAPGKIRGVIQTDLGDIEILLHGDLVPKTVANFVKLAEKGFYDGLIFHRVIPGFMIQTGCPQGNGRGDPGYKFRDEFHKSLRHNKAGILSMANSGPNTNGSQFFITVAPTSHLDNRHSVFGEVIKGLEIAVKISKVKRGSQDRPSKTIYMNKVLIFRENKSDKTNAPATQPAK